MSSQSGTSPSNQTVLILVICLLALIVLLILLYKKLNKEANGEYTISHMVYKEGGLRDRARVAASALETRLGVQLWPRSDSDEEEEMQEIHDEEGRVEEGDCQGSHSEEGDRDEEDGVDKVETEGKGGDTSGDDSSLDGSEAEEQTKLIDPPEEGEKGQETEEKAEDKEGKGEASGGASILIDLKQFSGSAIWSGDEGGEGKDSHVTAL